MFKSLFVRLQYILPQHLITALMGRIAECRTPWVKNFLIKRFIHLYKVDMSAVAIQDPEHYPSFNLFFIRELKKGIRPISAGEADIACPVDGVLAQRGTINQNQLLQAKGSYFDLETLLGGDSLLAKTFYDGSFATFYLAPYDYHRIHMPIAGELIKTIFVPGKLFSVNRMTTELVPQLYCRNERYICIFETAAGPMIMILVGAMIVGSIQTAWLSQPISAKEITEETYSNKPALAKGAELGFFKMGSTVIVLFQRNKATWLQSLHANDHVLLGELIGTLQK